MPHWFGLIHWITTVAYLVSWVVVIRYIKKHPQNKEGIQGEYIAMAFFTFFLIALYYLSYQASVGALIPSGGDSSFIP